jgi:phage terminase small subunit
VDLSATTRDQLAAVKELVVEDFFDGRGEDARKVRRVKIKLADKLAALDKLGRHLGIFNDKLELRGKLTLEQLVLGAAAAHAEKTE